LKNNILSENSFQPLEELMSRLICYCFGYTEEDLYQDALRHGRSLIMERILAEKKEGHCRCTETNPSGH
jgi:hypothetical protein